MEIKELKNKVFETITQNELHSQINVTEERTSEFIDKQIVTIFREQREKVLEKKQKYDVR